MYNYCFNFFFNVGFRKCSIFYEQLRLWSSCSVKLLRRIHSENTKVENDQGVLKLTSGKNGNIYVTNYK